MFCANYLAQELFFYENEFASKNFDYNGKFNNVIEGKMIKIKITNKEPLKCELEAFTESIINGYDSPITGHEGMEALKIAQAFIESAKNNKTITL